MAKDGLLEEYRRYMEDPEKIPSDKYAQSLVNRVIAKYGSIENAQRMISEKKEDNAAQEDKKTKSLENKLNFVKFSDNMQLNPDRVFDSRQDKEDLIRKYGYPQLYALYKEGKGDFLSKLSDSAIGELFKNTYYSVKKQLGK